MEITPAQKRKLVAAAELVDKGNVAVYEKILEFQDFVDEKEQKIEELTTKVAEEISVMESEVANTLAYLNTIEQPKDGEPGKTYVLTDKDKADIASKIKVPKVEKLVEKTETIREIPIVTENVVQVAVTDTPDEIVEKVNTSKKKIKVSQIDGLENLPTQKEVNDIKQIAVANSLPQTTSFVNGKRAKNLNFTGATVTVTGDTANVVTSGGGHTIQDEGSNLTQRTNLNFVGAGVTVTDDAGNDATIVTISTSAGAGFQQKTSGTVDGSNKSFTFAVAPNALSIDGVITQKTAVDGTTNWTGTTSITLSIAPNFDIFGVA